MNLRYDRAMWDPLTEEFFRHSDFFNWGYWPDGCTDPVRACEQLVDRLIGPLPGGSRILDAGCGRGAVTRRLWRTGRRATVVGINVSSKQLERCAQIAPGCEFHLMDAARPQFPAAHFDAVLCVESAFHFDSRERFLHETRRILRPGGRLALTDIVNDPGSGVMEPAANQLTDAADYRDLLRRTGFVDVTVTDEYRRCAVAHLGAWRDFLRRKHELGILTADEYALVEQGIADRLRQVRSYLMAWAKRPVPAG